MSTSKIQIGLRVDDEIRSKLKYLAEKESRSINNLVEHIIKQYLNDYELKNGVTLPVDYL